MHRPVLRRPTRRRAGAAALLALAACGATGNRSVGGLEPRPGSAPAGGVEAAGVAGAGGTSGGLAAPAPTSAEEAQPGAESERAAPASGEPGRPTAARDAVSDPVIGRAAGQDVHASELLTRWLHRESPRVRTYLEELVLEKVIAVEAQRLGVRLPQETIARETERVFAAIQEEIDATSPGLDLDEFIRRRRGLDPERYKARVASDRALELLAERCMRAWLLAQERCEVRVLLVTERTKLERVEEALAAGTSFEDLARSYSEHSSREEGGRMPAVVRSHTAISRLAFSTPVGQVGGPIDQDGQYLLVEVVERPEPVSGPWPEVRAAVEASLVRHPIEDPEYWQWKDAMLATYEVDTTRFLELVGEE